MGHIGNAINTLKSYGIKAFVKKEVSSLRYNRFTIRKRMTVILKASMNDAKLEKERSLSGLPQTDMILSILTPVYNTPEDILTQMIESVKAQTCPYWQLCIADGSDDEHDYVGEIIRKYSACDSRIVYKHLDKNTGISGNTNECATLASGDYIALLDHDDLLHPSAVYETIKAFADKAQLTYTDEATFSGNIGHVIDINLKPAFSPDTILGNNYICHFTAFTRNLFDECGGFRSECDGSQDHDIILRITNILMARGETLSIRHIPEVLYFWRVHAGSVSAGIEAKTYAIDAGIRAVCDAVKSRGEEATVVSTPVNPTIYKVIYPIKDSPKVSVIIPNKDSAEMLGKMLDSMQKTDYDNYEIIIAENNSCEPATFELYDTLREKGVKIITVSQDSFNYSQLINEGVRAAGGEYLLLLNNDMEIITPEYMREMLMLAMQPHIGAVGAKLLYANGLVQHCFLITGCGPHHVAVNAQQGKPDSDNGYLGKIAFVQDVSAVTGACLMVSKADYLAVGGMDEKLPVAYNDVDFCLKLKALGRYNVYTPFAKLYHYESVSRGLDVNESKRARLDADAEYMRNKWGERIEDEFYHKYFDKFRPYEIATVKYLKNSVYQTL